MTLDENLPYLIKSFVCVCAFKTPQKVSQLYTLTQIADIGITKYKKYAKLLSRLSTAFPLTKSLINYFNKFVEYILLMKVVVLHTHYQICKSQYFLTTEMQGVNSNNSNKIVRA